MFRKKIKDNRIFLLAISSSLFLLRSNIPYAIYLFSLLQLFLLIKLFQKKSINSISEALKKSLASFYAYYSIILFFILGFIINSAVNETYKDLINLSILLSFILIFAVEINSLEQFDKFKISFLYCFVGIFLIYLITYFLISAINNDLSNFFFVIKDRNFDKNIYTLNLWITIIALFYFVLNRFDKKIEIIPVNILIFLLLILVLFSSSRRGIVIFGVFSIIFVLFIINGIIKNNLKKKKLNIFFFLYIFMFFLLISSILISGNLRNQIFNNTIKQPEIKTKISNTTWRYYRLINPTQTFKSYQMLLWGTNIDKNKDIKWKQLLKIANKEYKETNYTQSINLIQQAAKKTDSIPLFFKLLPKEIKNKIQTKDKKIIPYLSEVLKLPYTYSNFFSCVNIDKLLLENLLTDTLSFPFVFSFKKDSAHINLSLPALANSNYELIFKIKSKKKPLYKLEIKNSTDINIQKNISNNSDTTFFSYRFSIQKNTTDKINLSILLINNVDSFAMSNIEWKLLNTDNNESLEKIYIKARKGLKKFKFEQNRSKRLWRYYYLASKLVDTKGQKKYITKNIVALINRVATKIRTLKYVATKVLKENNSDTVIFNSTNSFPRVRFDLPIIQNTTYKIEFDYSSEKNIPQLVSYLKRKPEIYNVYFRYKILSDSIIKLKNYAYRKTIILRVDSINSATSLFAFGFKKLEKSDTLIISNIKFEVLKTENDSILLSKAQYTYLKNWAEGRKHDEKLIELKKEVKQYQNKKYWKIDSAVYETSAADRLELWIFGWQYFKSLPLQKKVFGEGFKYYHLYKLKFGTKYGSTKGFSPHNPIIAALLYSGILGCIAYLFFLFSIFYYYIKYNKDLGIFTLLFILIFIYSFISGRTHFSIPYFILFSIFPFLINFIRKQKLKNNL